MAEQQIPDEQWAQVFEKLGGRMLTTPHLFRASTKAIQAVVCKKIPVAKPGPGEILINVKYSGVCHSDVHAMKGDWPRRPKSPLVSGHEGAGIVAAKGEDVTDFEIGDHVGVKWINGVCGKCFFCLSGQEQICPDATLSGYTVDGSFQQYAIAQASVTTKIPKDIDLAAVSPVMCAGLTVYKGLKESNARAGQYVAIVGAGGGLGLYGLQYAKAMGFIPIAVDGGEEKSRVCKKHGAAAYVDIETSSSVIDDLKKATPDGLGPHAAVIVSSEEEPFSHASEYVRPMGTVVIVGIPADGYIKSSVWDTVARLVTIKGSIVGNRYDADEAVEFFRRGLIKAPYKVVGLSQLKETLEVLDHSKVIERYIVDNSK